jgi:anti-anti-sigma factor
MMMRVAYPLAVPRSIAMIEVRNIKVSSTETLVELAGHLDRTGSDTCRVELQRLLTHTPRLVVDVANVTMFDPAGAGMLLGLAFLADVCDLEFVVAGASEQLDALFRMTRFDHERSKVATRRRRSRAVVLDHA